MYIYPRAGCVKLPPEPQSTFNGTGIIVVSKVIGLLALMAASIFCKGTTQGITFILTYIVPSVTRVFMAIGPFWMAQKFSIGRGYIWAALFILSGVAMPLFNIEVGYSVVGLMCIIVGFVLIHESSRLMIRGTLHVVEKADILFVEKQTGLTSGNLSAHMNKLEDVGYIEIKKEFAERIPRTLLQITEEGRKILLAYSQVCKIS